MPEPTDPAIADLPEDSGEEGFQAAMEPTVAALNAVADAYLIAIGQGGPDPLADSPSMLDLAAEQRFCLGGHWNEPIVDTHMTISILTFAGVDHMLAYAHLFASPPVPVYSHLATARAAIEAFAWARWLGDPTIDTDIRVKRNTVNRIHDARERRRFPAPEEVSKARRLEEQMVAGAPIMTAAMFPERCRARRDGSREPPQVSAPVSAASVPSGRRPSRRGLGREHDNSLLPMPTSSTSPTATTTTVTTTAPGRAPQPQSGLRKGRVERALKLQ